MPILTFEIILDASLDKVWAWHQDVRVALPALTPADREIEVERADDPLQLDSRVVLRMKGPFGRTIRWVARYTDFVPPRPVVFGAEARFTDEQESGPFAYWRHQHEFEAIDDTHTRLVDRVTYRAPLGPIGWFADLLFIRRQIHRMFAHRHRQMRKVFTSG